MFPNNYVGNKVKLSCRNKVQDGSSRLHRAIVGGTGWGLVFGLTCAILFQVPPRLSAHATVFSGAPVGLDEWVYFSLARAVWRCPNGITYQYPFSLFWQSPPVLVQIPITVAAWIGWWLGLPAAFELLRVIGSALTGGALGALGVALFGSRQWRYWFYILSAFGGAWFIVLAIWQALETAGISGLTELPVYVARTMDAIFWWLPFLAQNIWQPLETIYHSLVISAFACLMLGKVRLAALLGLLTWFSNPFPAAALYLPALPWLVLELGLNIRSQQRREKTTDLILWALTAVVGYGYYAWFLPQWPVLKELAAMHRVPLAPPPNIPQLVVWFAPFLPTLAWAFFTRAGRRQVFRRPAWRLIGLLYFSQITFLLQFFVLRHNAIQPYHFNRGYLALASFALLVRWVQSLYPRRLPRLVAVLLCTFLADQLSFFGYLATEGIKSGFVPQEIVQVANVFNEREAGQLFVSQAYSYSCYLAAATNQIPYDMPETMVVPWPKTRGRLLTEAIQSGSDAIEQLGISLFVVSKEDPLTATLLLGNWRLIGETLHYAILELPKEKRRQVPRLPPPENE